MMNFSVIIRLRTKNININTVELPKKDCSRPHNLSALAGILFSEKKAYKKCVS